MTKRFRRIQLTAVCFAVVLCAGALLPPSRAAQRPAREPKKAQEGPARLPKKTPGSRYLMFEVTVKGSGETQVDTTTRTWSVDRTYKSGLIELKSGQGPLIFPGMDSDTYFKAMMAKSGTSQIANKVPVRVIIKDSLRMVTTEMCPAPTGKYKETTVITKTWEGDDVVRPEISTGIARLQDMNHYNVSIPLVSSARAPTPLVYTEETAITGKPTQKVIEKRSLSSVEIPKVKGILEHPAVRHAEEQPLDVFESKFDYDSRPLTPLEPVFPEVRESRFQVKVRVRYRWATGPFSSLPEIE